jgi:hypothetical protein
LDPIERQIAELGRWTSGRPDEGAFDFTSPRFEHEPLQPP